MIRQITIQLPGATAFECGECRYYFYQPPYQTAPDDGHEGEHTCQWWGALKFDDDDKPLRHPACLRAETGIEGYRKGEEGRQCVECFYNLGESEDENWCNYGGVDVSPDGTCPKWAKEDR